MQPDRETTGALLAGAAGYSAISDDGVVGVVERPLFPPDALAPDFLVLRIRDSEGTRRPVVATTFVRAVDAERRVVRLVGCRGEIARLPERVPIAFTQATVRGRTSV